MGNSRAGMPNPGGFTGAAVTRLHLYQGGINLTETLTDSSMQLLTLRSALTLCPWGTV